MNRSPVLIMESVARARVTMATLHDRAMRSGSIDDLMEFSVIRTTVAKIEELLQIANEYDDLLLRQLARTDARVKLISG
jgi:hypothetical protein